MWSTIATAAVTTAITTAVTLLVTLLINGIISTPKKRKLRQQHEAEEKEKFKQELFDCVKNNNQKTSDELVVLHDDLKLCKVGIQAVIKNSLKTRYEKWIQEGYAPLDAKDDLERMYQVYHKLGANGVMDSLRARFLALPDYK